MKNRREELVERYINYEMTEAERKDFEQRVETDPKLRECFLTIHSLGVWGEREREKGLKEGLAALSKDEMQALLRTAREETQEEPPLSVSPSKPKNRGKLYRMVAVAAAVAVIALVVLFRTVSGDFLHETTQLYTLYFNEAPEVEYSRTGSGLPEETLELNKTVLQHYTQQEYETVARLYELNWSSKSIAELPVNSLIPLAYSLLETGKETEAITLLQQATVSQPSEEAEWMLLGAYLKVGNRKEAEKTAQSIVERAGAYTTEAEAVLVQLKEKK